MAVDRPTRVAVLYSGGTDSTASSAILADTFDEVHLLTYTRTGLHNSQNSAYNYNKLTARFPERRFVHRIQDNDLLAQHLSDHRRLHYVRKFGLFTLQSCGYCALTNHVSTLAYCLRTGVGNSADGITHDWPFFPGHMDKVIDKFRSLYSHYGITYHTPVLNFDVAPPPRYIDKLGLGAPQPEDPNLNTTGKLLYRLRLADTPNYKGTELDRQTQARCYQFTMPNMFINWVYRGQERKAEYETTIVEFFTALLDDCKRLIDGYIEKNENSALFAFLEDVPSVKRSQSDPPGWQARS
jgi:hypothetical protein